MSERPAFVHLLPALVPPSALVGGLAVVIDALRATTAMVHALAAGARGIVPCLEIDEARARFAAEPPGSALLGGERGGRPIEGFHLGNSPADFDARRCADKVVIMTTTNGTRAIHAATSADQVWIAAFVNRSATAAALAGSDRPIHLICAGTDGAISHEDTLAAGALLERLDADAANDAALLAQSAWSAIGGRNLLGHLNRSQGGQNVRALGLKADLAATARLDRYDLAARLDPHSGMIVRNA